MMTMMRTRSRIAPVLGLCICGLACGLASRPATAQFDSNNVQLKSWINLPALGAGGGNGNDCWGYVSPSGREYALMGVSNSLNVVEITDPVNPVIIGTIPHSDSLWGDIKTYLDYAYVVNEALPETGLQGQGTRRDLVRKPGPLARSLAKAFCRHP